MTLDEMILRVASDKRVITPVIHTIPNLIGMTISIADDLFFELAEASRGQHTYDHQLVRMCCRYLFRKAAVVVAVWGDADDGNVDVDAGLAEAIAYDVPPDPRPEMALVFAKGQEFGDALFECHADYVESQREYSGELFMIEMSLLFRWCMLLGISYAIDRRCHRHIPRGREIESVIPTAQTVAWMRTFIPRKS